MLSLEDKIVISLRRISQAIDAWSRRTLHVYGLTSPQLATLREIMAGNASMGTLSAALHVGQPTISGILTRLEQRGLITRERSRDDRRTVLIAITEEGCELASRGPTLLRDRFCEELRKLPVGEQERILVTLARVGEMMKAPDVSDVPYLFNE